MAEQKKYDKEYKVEAVKLAREIGRKKASEELGVSIGTLYGWVRQAADGSLDMGKENRTPDDALNLAQEVQALRKKVKQQEREIRRLTEENELLADASVGIAISSPPFLFSAYHLFRFLYIDISLIFLSLFFFQLCVQMVDFSGLLNSYLKIHYSYLWE